MTNRAAVVLIALIVGAGLYGGLVAVEDRLIAPTEPASNGEVVPANTTLHLDRVGRPTVVGRVVNGRDAPVADVRVTVAFFGDGHRLGNATGGTIVPVIEAGGASPFEVRLENRSARVDDYAVSLAYATGARRTYDGLAVADVAVSDRSQTQLIVVGTVTNTGGRRVAAHVVATFYDEDGAVVGARSARPSPGVLAPGDDGAFSVRFRTLGDVPSRASRVERFEVTAFATPPP